ncbi:MAG: hypothetical protein QM730_12210 [Anaerolineales bacterium]
MEENQDFFSPNHKRLLNVAAWSGTLSWIVLVAFILGAILQLLQYRNIVYYQQTNIWDFFRSNPMDAFRSIVNLLNTALKGVVYYLVLKGISLGLNMIVETDVNYREQRAEK